MSEYSLKIAVGTFRKNDRIVSKDSIYGVLRDQMSVGAHTEISNEPGYGYVRGLFNIQTKRLVFTSYSGYQNWNVKFSTVTELDIGAVFDFGFVVDLEGKININDEVNLIINILPIWDRKIAFIKQSFRDKIESISIGFFKDLTSRLKDIIIKMCINSNRKNVKIFGNILSRGKGFTLKTVTELLDTVGKVIDFCDKIISRGVYHLLFPKIDSAVNEIKPTDIIRDL